MVSIGVLEFGGGFFFFFLAMSHTTRIPTRNSSAPHHLKKINSTLVQFPPLNSSPKFPSHNPQYTTPHHTKATNRTTLPPYTFRPLHHLKKSRDKEEEQRRSGRASSNGSGAGEAGEAGEEHVVGWEIYRFVWLGMPLSILIYRCGGSLLGLCGIFFG